MRSHWGKHSTDCKTGLMIGPDPDTQDAAPRYLLDFLRYSLLKQGSRYYIIITKQQLLFYICFWEVPVLCSGQQHYVSSCPVSTPHHRTPLLSKLQFGFISLLIIVVVTWACPILPWWTGCRMRITISSKYNKSLDDLYIVIVPINYA